MVLGPVRCGVFRCAVYELCRFFDRMQDPDAETEEGCVECEGEG